MMRKKEDATKEKLSKSAASGAVALIFLILGFQLAIFVLKVVERPAVQESPAEVDGNGAEASVGGVRPADGQLPGDCPAGNGVAGSRPAASVTKRQAAYRPSHHAQAEKSRYGGYEAPSRQYSRPQRKVESFRFDPNTVSGEDLVRLGLSERQAESILNYREKGGRFRAKEDFGKMYVVSDTLYERLEPFIDIPRLELNSADSAALVSLRGIGPWYARKIIDYREALGGFCSVDQLLEINGMDKERLITLKPQVRVDTSLIKPLPIWDMNEEQLAAHPYVGRSPARSIVRFRRVCDTSAWTLENLLLENAIDSISARRLRPYIK